MKWPWATGTFSYINGPLIITSDSRVNSVQGGASKKTATVLYQADPSNYNESGLYSTQIDIDIDNPNPDKRIIARPPVKIISRGDHVPGLEGKIGSIRTSDSLNNSGQVAVYVISDQGEVAIVKATPPRKPVLIIPGIAGSFPTDFGFLEWLLNRGVNPDTLLIDPISGVYDDLIQSLRNAGYEEGKDLFIANYDWRLEPGPDDRSIDGRIGGLSAESITDNFFEYGVDYLGHWLRQATEAWQTRYPDIPLDSVDVIAHSTALVC